MGSFKKTGLCPLDSEMIGYDVLVGYDVAHRPVTTEVSASEVPTCSINTTFTYADVVCV